jgi:hypothetical protein
MIFVKTNRCQLKYLINDSMGKKEEQEKETEGKIITIE